MDSVIEIIRQIRLDSDENPLDKATFSTRHGSENPVRCA